MATMKVRCKLGEFCRLASEQPRSEATFRDCLHPIRRENLSSPIYSAEMVFPNVTHELRLQLLGAKLAADVERPFAVGDVFIPGAQVKRRLVNMLAGCPHQPPAVGTLLQDSTVGAGTAIKGARDWVLEITELQGSELLLAEFTYSSGNYGEVNRFVSSITCRSDISAEA